MTDDILPGELFYGYRAYICGRPHLNPLREVLNRHNGEGVVALRWG
jgi:hypothetical protein